MGLFDWNNEEGKQKEFEKRQHNYQMQQQSYQTVGSPHDEQLEFAKEQYKTDLLRWQQDLENELVKLRYRLKNYYQRPDESWVPQLIQVKKFDKETGEYKIKEIDAPPILNNLGISMIESELEPLVSRNIINSNLSEERILWILKRTCRSIKNDLVNKYDFYEINPATPSTLSNIMSLVKNVIIASPYRALNGWNKKIDSTISKRLENIFPNQEEKKKRGLFHWSK
jgi:hypothetical protein